jgi:hypothetical protein
LSLPGRLEISARVGEGLLRLALRDDGSGPGEAEAGAVAATNARLGQLFGDGYQAVQAPAPGRGTLRSRAATSVASAGRTHAQCRIPVLARSRSSIGGGRYGPAPARIHPQAWQLMKWTTWLWNKPSFHSLLERFLFKIYTPCEQDGITIYADPADGPVEQAYEWIASARRLLRRVDPARSRRVESLLRNIVVKEGVPTQYWRATQTCCVERKALETSSDALIASYLVHEAAHARLCRHGIDSTPRSTGRVEAVCIRDQIGFLNRLPRDRYPTADRLIEYYANVAARGLEANGRR